jgi:hypothetical protein
MGCAPDLPWRTPDIDEHGDAIRARLRAETLP